MGQAHPLLYTGKMDEAQLLADQQWLAQSGKV